MNYFDIIFKSTYSILCSIRIFYICEDWYVKSYVKIIAVKLVFFAKNLSLLVSLGCVWRKEKAYSPGNLTLGVDSSLRKNIRVKACLII